MEIVEVKGNGCSSKVLVGEHIENITSYVNGRNVFIIIDDEVQRLYGSCFHGFSTFIIKSGEQSKQISTLHLVYQWLLDSGADRTSFIVGVGGGVVCDIAGFVASTFMRGVNFGFVATTLLAQVDASVGGKNGVDFNGYKNIIGTFNQPQFVICDTNMLKTLSWVELSNGFAEMLKHAIIADSQKFKLMEQSAGQLFDCESNLINRLVLRSIQIKAQVVEADEREHGIRKTLNLGHTWGHAVETLSGLPHGQCVGIGLEFSARISLKLNMISESTYHRICNILKSLRLPTKIEINPDLILNAMRMDKKRCGDYIDFVLIREIGRVEVKRMAFDQLAELI